MDLIAVLSAWRIEPTSVVRVSDMTHSNETYRVESIGGTYFLRKYMNDVDLDNVEYEHQVLTSLGRQALPFSVPVPERTDSGGTFAVLGSDSSSDRPVAALFSAIPGTTPDTNDLRQVQHVGRALGQLLSALQRVSGLKEGVQRPTYGQLHLHHPEVPDPLEAIMGLPVPMDYRRYIEKMTYAVLEAVPQIYKELPVQIIHGDFHADHVLLSQGRVTGIIDFEFATPDLRVMDVVSGIGFICFVNAVGDVDLKAAEAFMRGFNQTSQLKSEEIAAVPQLIRLREVALLLHWAGRWKLKRISNVLMRQRVDEVMTRDQWLANNGDTLLEAILPSSQR